MHMMQHVDWWWLYLLPLLYIAAPRTWVDGELVTSAMMNSLRDLFKEVEAGTALMKRIKLDLLEAAEYTATYLSAAGNAVIAFIPYAPSRIAYSSNGSWWGPLGGVPSSIGYQDLWLSARSLRPSVPFVGYAAEDKSFSGGAYRADTGVPFPLGLSVCYWEIILPKSWSPADVLYLVPYWFGVAAGSGNIEWAFQFVGISHGETLDQYVQYGSATQDSFIGPEIMHIAPAAAISLVAAKGDYLRLFVYRNSDSVQDTLSIPAYLMGIKIYFRTNAATDA